MQNVLEELKLYKLHFDLFRIWVELVENENVDNPSRALQIAESNLDALEIKIWEYRNSQTN